MNVQKKDERVLTVRKPSFEYQPGGGNNYDFTAYEHLTLYFIILSFYN